MKRDFKKALERFDQEAKNVPVGPSAARVWARLSFEEKAFGVRWGRAVGWAAAVVLLVVGYWVWQGPEPKAHSVAGFAVQLSEGATVAEVAGTVVVSRGDCVLTDEDVVLNVSKDTQVRRNTEGIKLVTGKVTVSARHRRKQERPLRFLVSGGTVEVMGTRFTLIDDGTRGELMLHEGVVRFISHSGDITELRAGETIEWPPKRAANTRLPEPQVVPEPPPSPVVEKPTVVPEPERDLDKKAKRVVKTARSKTPDDLDEVLEHVAELRNRGEHEAAIAELRRASGTVRDPKTRERLSFEIGSVLTHQMKQPERACEHWRKHSQMFRAGRYAQEIRLLSQQLRCGLE